MPPAAPDARPVPVVLAVTGEHFAGFAPYAPALGDDGTAAFQARLWDGLRDGLRDGRSGIFVVAAVDVATQATPDHGAIGASGASGAAPPCIEVACSGSGGVLEIASHPDLRSADDVCAYVRREDGRRWLMRWRGGRAQAIAPDAGPLGPTMNGRGSIAFRRGVAGDQVLVAGSEGLEPRARTGHALAAIHGVPAINAHDEVAFAADLSDGRQAIVVAAGRRGATRCRSGRSGSVPDEAPVDVATDDGTAQVAAVTGGQFEALGRFPTIDDHGTVVFNGVRRGGRPGLFAARDGRIMPLDVEGGPLAVARPGISPPSLEAFEHVRAALVSADGHLLLAATPVGGTLGLFRGLDPVRDRLLAIGASLLKSTVVDFTLNAVSVGRGGAVIVRTTLSDGREAIVRWDGPAVGGGEAAGPTVEWPKIA